MNMDTGSLFTPLVVRGVTLANRIVMSPMTRGFSPNGLPGSDVAAYYKRRAQGETGLIITEGVGVDHPAALGEAGLGENSIPVLAGEESVAAWRRVTGEVHASGGIIFPQLWHMGPMKEANTGPFPAASPLRPSGLWGPAGRTTSLNAGYMERVLPQTRPMTDTEIADAGVDIFEASTRYFNRAEFPGSEMNLAGWAKKVTGQLSMAMGGIGINKGYYDSMAGAETSAQPDLAPLLDRFSRNEFDLVGVGRSLLHDPNWARRARIGEPFLGFSNDSLARLT